MNSAEKNLPSDFGRAYIVELFLKKRETNQSDLTTGPSNNMGSGKQIPADKVCISSSE